MQFKEQFIGTFQPLFLALAAVWTIGIGVALAHPQPTHERNGVVEIYSLVAVGEPRSGV